MANNHSTAILIDQREKALHYMVKSGANLVTDTKQYSSKDFDQEFFDSYILALQGFMKTYTPSQSVNTTVILPDSAIYTDTVPLPSLKGTSVHKTVETTLAGLLANRQALRIQMYTPVQNKQYSVVCLSGVKESLLSNIKASNNAARLVASRITFASEATVLGASALNPKLRNASYLLFDVKENFTRVVYVFHGEAVGFSSLPFGFSILDSKKTVAEDMLFDHSVAELAVLNARERAKAKSLTVMDAGNVDVSDVEEEEDQKEAGQAAAESATENKEDDEEEEKSFSVLEQAPRATETLIKILPKKTPRKLPKFMQRPIPETAEGFLQENFRIFVKWALNFLAGNERLLKLGKMDGVYFNLPSEFYPVVEAVNAEEKENGIRFHPLCPNAKDAVALRNLELFGGLFVGTSKSHNIFQ